MEAQGLEGPIKLFLLPVWADSYQFVFQDKEAQRRPHVSVPSQTSLEDKEWRMAKAVMHLSEQAFLHRMAFRAWIKDFQWFATFHVHEETGARCMQIYMGVRVGRGNRLNARRSHSALHFVYTNSSRNPGSCILNVTNSIVTLTLDLSGFMQTR